MTPDELPQTGSNRAHRKKPGAAGIVSTLCGLAMGILGGGSWVGWIAWAAIVAVAFHLDVKVIRRRITRKASSTSFVSLTTFVFASIGLIIGFVTGSPAPIGLMPRSRVS